MSDLVIAGSFLDGIWIGIVFVAVANFSVTTDEKLGTLWVLWIALWWWVPSMTPDVTLGERIAGLASFISIGAMAHATALSTKRRVLELWRQEGLL